MLLNISICRLPHIIDVSDLLDTATCRYHTRLKFYGAKVHNATVLCKRFLIACRCHTEISFRILYQYSSHNLQASYQVLHSEYDVMEYQQIQGSQYKRLNSINRISNSVHRRHYLVPFFYPFDVKFICQC